MLNHHCQTKSAPFPVRLFILSQMHTFSQLSNRFTLILVLSVACLSLLFYGFVFTNFSSQGEDLKSFTVTDDPGPRLPYDEIATISDSTMKLEESQQKIITSTVKNIEEMIDTSIFNPDLAKS